MLKVILICVFVLGLIGCDIAHCPDQKDCGGGCAPASASCCPSGTQYCNFPLVCGGDNMCHSNGGGGSTCNTGCPSTAPWKCGGLCYSTVPTGDHNCVKCN